MSLDTRAYEQSGMKIGWSGAGVAENDGAGDRGAGTELGGVG